MAMMGWGVYCYLGASAARVHRIIGPFVNVVYGYIPYGLGCVIIGTGTVMGRGPLSGAFAIVALVLVASGILLWFWHPYWIRPKWLRNAWGD